MFEIIKAVIEHGTYDLRSMITKIDTLWIQSDITDEERETLLNMARENAIPSNSYQAVQAQLDNMYKEFTDKFKTINLKIAELEGNNVDEPTKDEEMITEYVQPTGAHDAYNTGDKVLFGDKVYQAVMDGLVWNPAEYPQGWEEVIQ